MKKILGKFFSIVNPIILPFFIKFFSLVNQLKSRPRVLIYTDSRGFEVTKPWNRKNPFSSYIKYFIFRYNCDVVVCPQKFTSFLDFLDLYKNSSKKYDFVILHCGIVDLAPRPKSSYMSMCQDKYSLVLKYNLINKIKFNPTNFVKYEGEYTSSFLNYNIINTFIIPELKSIENLIYISINPVLDTWRGEYWRDRPENINDQLVLEKQIKNNLLNIVDLGDLSESDIQIYTTDNVHYNTKGFEYIKWQLINIIAKISNKDV